jgi:hypothetical protein
MGLGVRAAVASTAPSRSAWSRRLADDVVPECQRRANAAGAGGHRRPCPAPARGRSGPSRSAPHARGPPDADVFMQTPGRRGYGQVSRKTVRSRASAPLHATGRRSGDVLLASLADESSPSMSAGMDRSIRTVARRRAALEEPRDDVLAPIHTPSRGPAMVAFRCPCGRRLEATEGKELLQLGREHADREHPDMRIDAHIHAHLANGRGRQDAGPGAGS